MQVKLLLFPLVLGIVPLVLVVLGCWTECLQGGGPHERRARTRHFHAAGASRGLRWTAYGAVALPEPLRAAGTVRTSTGITGKLWLPFPS